MSYDCFISYQSGDLKFAEQVLEGLLAAGIARERVWFDKERLKPGFEWYKEIEQGCEASRIVLPVLTPRWQQSPWTRFETYGAESVVPLRFQGRFEDIAPPPLKRFQAHEVSFADGDPAIAWERLATAIRALLERPLPQKAERILLLRYHHNPHFVGREDELLAVHQRLHDNPTATLTQGQVHVIAALGGMGKTTLAREYAEKFWRCYAQILWVDARNPGGLEAEYADLFAQMHPEAGENKQAERAQRMLRQLNGREERLLIIDNAEDEASVQRWLPKSGGCRTLITSRFTDWSAAIGVTRIEALLPAAARQLLLERTGVATPPQEELTACDELAGQLGFLPLALEQAAAYMRKQRMSFIRYLQRYTEETATLLQKGVLGSTEYPDAVMTTWAATITRLPPSSRALLRLASFMAATPVPLELFAAGVHILRNATKILRSQELPEAEEEYLPDDAESLVREALGLLADYSMVVMEDESFRVHGLVQTVERLSLPLDRLALWSLGAISFIEACPEDPSDPVNWPFLRQAALHLDHACYEGWIAAEKFNKQQDATDETSPAEIFTLVLQILVYLGKYLTAAGGFVLAERYLRLAIDNDGRLPEDPRRTVQAVYHLSNLLVETDRLEEAVELRHRELALCEAELGAEHLEVATPLLRLARTLTDKGDYQQAEHLLLRALEIADDHQTAAGAAAARRCLYALADLYQNTGRNQEADRVWQRLETMRQQAPAEDESRLLVREDLLDKARHHAATGNAESTGKLLDEFLAANEQAFGVQSDPLAIARSCAADVYRDIGKYDSAEQLLAAALQTQSKIYGDLHREIAEGWSSLAQLYALMERRSDALNARRIAVKILEHNFPDGNASISEELLALADLMEDSGEDAEPAVRRALTVAEKARDPSHPLIARCCTKLGFLLLAREKFDEAEAFLRRTLAIYAKHYGNASAEAGELLRTWTRGLCNTGQLERASAVAFESLAMQNAIHGSSLQLLPDLDLVGWIAMQRQDWPRYEETLRLGLSIIEKSAGRDHARYVEWSGALGFLLYALERRAEAEPLLRSGMSGAGPTAVDAEHWTNCRLALATLLEESGRRDEALPLTDQCLRGLLQLRQEQEIPLPLLSTAAATWIALRLRGGMNGGQANAGLAALFDEYALASLLDEIHAHWQQETAASR